MINKRHTFFSYILILFVSFSTFIFSQEPEQQVPSVEQTSNLALPNNLAIPNFDPQELQDTIFKIFNELQDKLIKERQLKREILPLELQTILDDAGDVYATFSEHVNVSNILLFCCETVRGELGEIEKGLSGENQERCTLTLYALEKLQAGLIDGSFSHILDCSQAQLGGNGPADMFGAGNPLAALLGGMQGLQPRMLAEPYEKEDLDDLIEKLESVQTLIENNAETFFALQDLLLAIQEQDVDKLILLILDHIKPRLEQTFVKLKESIAKFEKALEKIVSDKSFSAENRKKIIKAIEYWCKELEKFAATLRTFDTLQKSAMAHNPKTFNRFFKWFAYGHDIYTAFLSKYKSDYYRLKDQHRYHGTLNQFNKSIVLPNLLDVLWHHSMTLWYFNNSKTEFRKGMLLDSALGKRPIASLSSLEVLMHNVMALLPTLGVFFMTPSFWCWQPGDLLRSYFDIAVSWAYSAYLSPELFTGLDGKFHLKNSLVTALAESNRILITEYASQKVRDMVDPFVLDKIEKVTLGVVRPEMLGAATSRIFIPLFLRDFVSKHASRVGVDINFSSLDVQFGAYRDIFNKKFSSYKDTIENIKRDERTQEQKDFLKDYYRFTGGYYTDLNGNHINAFAQKHQGIVTNFVAVNEQTFNKNVLDPYFFEYQILEYIFLSVGSHLGRIIAKKHSSSIVGALGKLGDAFFYVTEKFHFAKEGTYQNWKDYKEDIQLEYEQTILILKEVGKMLFAQPNFKSLFVTVLTQRGYLPYGETDEALINRVMLERIITMLFSRHFLTAFEASKLFKKIKEIKGIEAGQKLGLVIEDLVDAIADNILPFFGSVVGGLSCKWVGFKAVNKWGPVSSVPGRISNWWKS